MRKEKMVKGTWLRQTVFVISCLMLLIMVCSIVPQTVAAATRTFTHPGMLHTDESFAAMKENVEKEVQPSLDTWTNLKNSGFSASDWQPRVAETVVRGGDGSNYAAFHIDIRRAYQTALVWKVSGSEAHGEAACRILNAWSGTMKNLTGNADRFLAAGIYGYELANVSEIMRDHPSFDEEAMETLLLEVFYPMTDDFLTNHNGAHFGNYWANWDLCNIASMMAIGIYADRADIYEQALDYYRNGIGMGSLYNAMPYVYEEGLAQWQESGRDQGHTTLGISLCGAICEMAWNQGDDLYSLSDNRFLKAAEYVAKYNNMEDVPYQPYERYSGQNGKSEFGNEVSNAGRGSVRPVYSLVYNHYVTRMGLEAPMIERILFPEDGYKLELECGNGDELGWQTLTFMNTGEPAAAKENSGVLKDGIYRIRSTYSGKSLVADAQGNLSSERRGSNDAEWWRFENTGDGEYIITNTVTGQVLQVPKSDNMYANDAVWNTGAKDDSIHQRFAIIPNDSQQYRIIASLNDFCMCVQGESTANDAAIIQWKYYNGRAQKWYIESKTEAADADAFMRADFTFDDEITGFSCEKAVAAGKYTLTDSHGTGNGQALYLDGSAEQYLSITKPDGTSLLTGASELTISFDVKPDRTDTNWAFYLAPNNDAQTYTKEKYIGVMLKDGNITVERYNNNGKRPSVLNAEGGNDWVTITVAMDAGGTELYVDGEKITEGTSGYTIADIAGEQGVLYIGRANWGSGEYFKGWIDNLTICSRALTMEQLETLTGEVVTPEPKPTPTPDVTPTPDPTPAPGHELPYVDVAKTDWFYDAVAYTYWEEVMTGMDPTHFGPYESLSRAQFALILYRIEGEPNVTSNQSFADISGGEWYGQAVLWAAEAGIVKGYENGCFGPVDLITREQMAVMMYRYANYLKKDTGSKADYSSFSDAADVSAFAEEGMKWAVAEKIITGKEQGTMLDPQGATARAEAAAIIQRFMELE